ncbi:MAG TPA: hypothetical protein VFL36_13710 [Myxococcales bacterium]|nr:hypothetical protein [Myxococcales bacterium]
MTVRLRSMSLAEVVVLICASACAQVKVQSNKRQDYDKKLERTLVAFTNMERFGSDYRRMLRDRTIAEFEKRGVAAAFAATPDRLALENSPSFDDQARAFNASTALIVQRIAGTVERNTGQILDADFDAQLIDLATRKRVWRATIRYASGGSLVGDSERVEKLVGGLANALANDGLLASAPAPSTAVAAAPGPSQAPPAPETAAAAPPAAPAGGSFPHVLTAPEIGAHFARYPTFAARQGPQQFTLYVRPGNQVERVCPGCRIPDADGTMEIDADHGTVCFRWRATWYPDSGCYQIVQTAADHYTMRGVGQQRPIEYSAGH